MATSIVQQIQEAVERLPEDRQQEVLRYVRGMDVEAKNSIDEFRKLAGTMTKEDGRALLDTIEEGCGQVNLDEW